ncbi:hypothetical protein O181_028867 [Austropuccinia psidii MF-1]|uniref:Uncharacterized protein n=1 Tax=Austropuccinia psidii MF-1 TaxID=1389203 RepID=A0A9Q3CVG5_9BASI|nr:hypothetical protein [Austropuccinia psidii MF-1]
MAFLGQLGPLQPLPSVGHLGPFWPNPMRPKGAKGDIPLAPKARWGPPEPVLAPNSIKPQNGQKTLRTQFRPKTTMEHFSAHGLWHPPDKLSSIFPLTLRGILPVLHAPRTQGCRSGAYMVLYTIMHPFCSAIQ